MTAPNEDRLKDLYVKHSGNVSLIAKEVGRARSTVQAWYRRLGMGGQGVGGNPNSICAAPVIEQVAEFPEFADDDISVDAILDSLEQRFEKRWEHHQQKNWFPIKINYDGPIGVAFIGDPHLDDNGCNIPLVRHHAEILAKTRGMFAVNIGDSENNWVGRMARLWAEQDTSITTAHKLTGWFLRDAGINWLCWLMGNHDLWSDLPALMREMNVDRIPMEDWQARFRLVFPNDRECRVWAAHNFKGHSMWNSLHGPQKAAHMKSEANIYACGHTHNWAIHQEESASKDQTYWLVRSRGYKFIDSYGEQLGHFPQREGASITCIIDPYAKSEAGFVQAFADMDAAADYLTWLRK